MDESRGFTEYLVNTEQGRSQDMHMHAHARFIHAMLREGDRAMEIYAPLHSAHEAYAVILEELEEFWDQVRMHDNQRAPAAMRAELVQVAAMCLRTVMDLALGEGGHPHG